MTKLRQSQRTREAYGELDEIVVRLFDDLASEDELPRSAVSAARRAAASGRDSGVRPAHSNNSDNPPTGPTPRVTAPGELDIERLFADKSRLYENAAFTLEEQKFIQDTVAWLAPRANADLLLDRIEEDLWLNAVAGSREDAVDKERADESAVQRTTSEGNTQGGQ
jgi:hypothetical protein